MIQPRDNGQREPVFLGGTFLSERIDEVQRESRGPVQFLADALQDAVMCGFAKTSDAPLRVVTLSEDMTNTLNGRGLGTLPISIFNSPSVDLIWSTLFSSVTISKHASVRRIVFAGSLGQHQNLIFLSEGVVLCFERHTDLALMFFGDWVVLEELKRQWESDPQVSFVPFLPLEQVRQMGSSAETGLLSLPPNLNRFAYQSKIPHT